MRPWIVGPSCAAQCSSAAHFQEQLAADAPALADAMAQAIVNPELKEPFVEFRSEAARRYDVKNSADKLIALFKDLLHSRSD